MLEDFTMEKKSGRSGQPQIKGNGTESKKNPDSVGNKIFPRTSRRRESINSQGTKYETNRKPIPQKSKSIDKRPRPRGQYYGSGKEDTKVAEDDEVEYGSVLVQGSKKQNLNHLLNFHYAPREGTNSGLRNWRANGGGWGRSYAFKSHKHKYNKEQFLQANCQFVVKSGADYSSYMVNPDMLVDWEFIEQIRLRSTEMLSCPICLYLPVAAKMTRCGHVFCWSCILHYLALSDKSWRKCPICFESVNKKDLKSVVAIPHNSFSVGEEITLCLMKRKRGSLVALPVTQSEIHSADKLLYVSETEVDTKYSKLLLASSTEVSTIISREKFELKKQLTEEEGCPEICFTEEALKLLEERESVNKGELVKQPLVSEVSESTTGDAEMFPMCESLDVANADIAATGAEEIKDDFCMDSTVDETNRNFGGKFDEVGTGNRERYESVSSEGLESEEGNLTVEDIETPHSENTAAIQGGSVTKDFYFYQAADGQHIYLHALNVRMLEHYYGCLKNCPLTLTGRIVEKESGSMTEDLRQRLRCLQHLPVTCQFEIAEIQLKPPVVNRDTIENFQDQLEMRKLRRQRRARYERRREKRINEEEDRRWGKFRTPNISINSHSQFPLCGVEVENIETCIPASATSSSTSSPAHSYDLFAPVASTLENLSLDEKPLVEFSASPGNENASSSGPSFAQMLRDGKSKPVYGWPTASSKKSKGLSAYGKNNGSDSDPEYEGFVPVKQSFGDAIAEAMEKAAAAAAVATAPSSKDDMQDVPGGYGKKKKKQKQKHKLLFATGMACISK